MENAADYVIFMDNGKVVEQGFTEMCIRDRCVIAH